jgi:pimeloyl-ACP methyl ester carboxylesterase
MTLAAGRLGLFDEVHAQSGTTTQAGSPGTHTSFGSLKQIDAGALNVGYAEAGPVNGPVVMLLHGWPYDIHTYVDVAPLLAAKGYRVIVPHVRGYGSTTFLSTSTVRNGQPAVIALDVIALMDALSIDTAIVAGCDWGARTAAIVAALWPERCKALVSVSGYLIGGREANKKPLPPQAELQWWYQFYFATERGRIGYEGYRRDFGRARASRASAIDQSRADILLTARAECYLVGPSRPRFASRSDGCRRTPRWTRTALLRAWPPRPSGD